MPIERMERCTTKCGYASKMNRLNESIKPPQLDAGTIVKKVMNLGVTEKSRNLESNAIKQAVQISMNAKKRLEQDIPAELQTGYNNKMNKMRK